MSSLFRSTSRLDPNVYDEFSCNVFMYALRFQRFHLFELLLRETSIDADFSAKDPQGNTILHYAVVYCRDQTQICDRLIDQFKHWKLDVDHQNQFGFTPLLSGKTT